MSDDVVCLLLRAEADRLSVGVTPPPLDLLSARRPRRLLPVAAAAAVVLVAGAAFAATIGRHVDRGPVPITHYAAVVPYDRDEPTAEFGDVPAPASGLTPGHRGSSDYDTDQNPHCAAADIAASLVLADGEDAGRLQLTWTGPADSTCRLRDDAPTVTLYDDKAAVLATSTYTTQPPVVNPPAYDARYLYAKARATGFTWKSDCAGPAVRAEITGLTAEPISASVSGNQPPCKETTAVPRLGLFGGDGVAPADRAGLQVRLLPATEPQPAGSVQTIVAELANPTRAAISLTPCPTWLLETKEQIVAGEFPRGMSSGRTTRVPCGRLPAEVASGSAVRFEVQERIGSGTPDIRGVQPVELYFAIAGAPGWRGSVNVDHGTPKEPVAMVPWKDTPKPPGEPMTGPPEIGKILPLASLHPTIEGLPQSVHPGQTLHYWVRVTDMATGGEPTSLVPCPGFVQSLSVNRESVHVDDEHYVNCDAAPDSIAPGTSIGLQMQLTIPADAPHGTATISWKLGKLDMSGSESTMSALTIN